MSTDISPDHSNFIDQQVAKGTFQDRQHALDAALQLLQQQTEVLDRVDRGRQQLEEGECTEYDEEGLKRRFDELKGRVASQVKTDQNGS